MTGLHRLLSRVDRGDLDWLVAIVWPPSGGRTASPDPRRAADRSTHERYVVFPRADRPLLVLPLLGRRATVRALLARSALQSRANLLLRAAAAAAAVLGFARLPVGRLTVARRHDATPAPPEEPLLELLGRQLGATVSALVVLGPRDANRKPVLELVDETGVCVGFAKIGWNAPTRALVDNEARSLRRLLDGPPAADLVQVPAVLMHRSVGDLTVLVTAPMPRKARAWPNAAAPSTAAVAATAAALSPTGRVEEVPLVALGLWERQRAELRGDCRGETAAGILLQALDAALGAAPHDVSVPVGGWHGDWAPWNLATVDGQAWAWDWEHASPDMPVGFDALHYRFAVLLHVDRLPTAAAVDRLRNGADALLTALGVPAEATGALVTGYLVERWLRAHRLRHDGGGWDPVIHPAVADALAVG